MPVTGPGPLLEPIHSFLTGLGRLANLFAPTVSDSPTPRLPQGVHLLDPELVDPELGLPRGKPCAFGVTQSQGARLDQYMEVCCISKASRLQGFVTKHKMWC